MTEYLVLSIWAGDDVSAVSLHPTDLKAAQSCLSWQRQGGLGGNQEIHRYDPVRRDWVGIDSFIPRIPSASGWTKEAWAAFVERYPLCFNEGGAA